MPKDSPDTQALIDAWRTSHRVTVYLVENLPPELWAKNVPGVPRRTVRMIAAHIHNTRCMRTVVHGSATTRASAAGRSDRRAVAVEEASARVKTTNGAMREGITQYIAPLF